MANIQKGNLVHKDEQVLPTFSLAIKTQTFGEGAERIVRKVRFLDSNGVFVGPMMVAKESRFVEYHGSSYQQQLDYHTNFMRTQYIASSFAKLYNMAITDARNHYFVRNDIQDLLRSIPTIHFIEPMVIDLIEKNGLGEKNILIERYLKGEYKKFNNNAGYVEEEVKRLVNRMYTLGLGSNNSLNNRSNNNDTGLGAIAEDSYEEDDDESDDDGGEVINEIYNKSNLKQIAPHNSELKCSIDTLFSLLNQDACFPQAFSHFTYEKSKRKLMVVDLQGVFTVNKADGTKVYELTDPVIHQRPLGKKSERRIMNFGRTDRGILGMTAFFESHECNGFCKFLGLSEVNVDNMK